MFVCRTMKNNISLYPVENEMGKLLILKFSDYRDYCCFFSDSLFLKQPEFFFSFIYAVFSMTKQVKP